MGINMFWLLDRTGLTLVYRRNLLSALSLMMHCCRPFNQLVITYLISEGAQAKRRGLLLSVKIAHHDPTSYLFAKTRPSGVRTSQAGWANGY